MSGQAGPVRTLSGYLWWTHERGSFHYDVMVTLILLFLFIAPHVVDFHDRPLPEVPKRASEVLVRDDGQQANGHRFTYEVRVDDVRGAHSEQEVNARIAAIVHTIANDARIEAVTPVFDPHRHIVAYDAVVLR